MTIGMEWYRKATEKRHKKAKEWLREILWIG